VTLRSISRLEALIAESRKLSTATKANYQSAVRSFVESAGAHANGWTPQAVEAWIAKLIAAGLAPQSINKKLSAVSWASRRLAAMQEGADFARPIEELREDEGPRRPQRALTKEEVTALVATCGGTRIDERRDLCILLLGLNGALRRHEIAKVKWTDLDPATGALKVKGKGGFEATIFVGPTTRTALAAYKSAMQRLGYKPHYVFPSGAPSLIESGDDTHLHNDTIYEIILRRAAQAGIKTRLTPHTLRHTCSTRLLEAGVEPWKVQKHMRHKSMSMTLDIYAHAVGDDIPEVTK
jgi:Site-specific recombinase XerD